MVEIWQSFMFSSKWDLTAENKAVLPAVPILK